MGNVILKLDLRCIEIGNLIRIYEPGLVPDWFWGARGIGPWSIYRKRWRCFRIFEVLCICEVQPEMMKTRI